MESSDDGSETAAEVAGTPAAAAALERHVNALASESISQPSLSTQRRHTTEVLPGPIVDNVATNDGTAADLEDSDVAGAAVISSLGEDTMFLHEILSLYVNEEVLTGGKEKDEKREMDVDGKPNGAPANGSTPTPRPFSFGPPDNLSEHEMALHRGVGAHTAALHHG
ncbi:hypothetical protein EDB19DRAFT_1915984 [Suillus lakei]|nr:hypothetical protein EDB19DRAFT_1915984 [Suillus lakei]